MSENKNFSTEKELKYTILKKIGEGRFGKVFKAVNNHNVVAIKKTYAGDEEEDGFLSEALKEVNFLSMLNHENVIKIFDNYYSEESNQGCVNLVMQYCEFDLTVLINSKSMLSLAKIQNINVQILKGLSYVHLKKIMHRDLKPANILVTKMGIIKLADFGLADKITKENDEERNTEVVSLWYRAPELLLRYTYYDSKIDLWSVGCIMAELWKKKPVLRGCNNLKQLQLINQLCGSITPDVWPKVQRLPLYYGMNLPQDKERRVQKELKSYIKDSDCLDLIDKLLVIDPDKRMDCETALKHEFFKKNFHPIDLVHDISLEEQSIFL